MNVSTKKLTGSGGVDLYYAEWVQDAPHALVFVVHGIAEHLDRHAELIKRLTDANYAVAGIDLRGHGRSSGTRIYVDTFDLYVSDITLALLRARQHYPNLPVVVCGHSMGALIALLYDVVVKQKLDGLILSSGAFVLPDNPFLQKASGVIGALLPNLPTVKVDTRYLSRDKSVVQNANTDPMYYTGRVPARTGAQFVEAAETAREHASEVRTPLLVFHGTADRITSPEGSELIFEQARSVDKTLHLFPGLYHETFNEPEKEQVYELIQTWLAERFE